MRVEFRLPDIGEGLESGEIVSWLVAPGDEVARDQPLVEVQTDKALVELPSPVAGKVLTLNGSAGDIIRVGELLVVLEGTGGTPGPNEPPARAAAAGTATDPATPRATTPPAGRPTTSASRPKAAPAVRKLALERGIDLSTVQGTGPGGRILAADLEAPTPAPVRATTAPRDAQAATESLGQMAPGRHPLRGIRRAVAQSMSRSWSEIPHITAMDEVDATALLDARRHLEGVSLPALFVAACARTLRRYPLMNASLEGDEIVVHQECNVGVAVATDAGLTVPVVTDADKRPLTDLSAEISRLVEKARAGRLELADLRGGTFTVNNYGSLGGRFATPLIRPPEAGIMGFGHIAPRPFVVDGAVVARPTLPYSLAADHRLIDGDLLAAFAGHVAALLAAPIRLVAGS